MAVKVADNLVPSEPVLKVLNFLSKVMPKAKLIPQQDLAELAFREPSKRKLVGISIIYLSFTQSRALLCLVLDDVD